MPSSIRVKVEVSDFDGSIDEMIANVDKATRAAVEQSSHLFEAEAKTNFGPVHGKGTPKTVFDRPQSISGDLRRSIQVIEVRQEGSHAWKSRTAPQMIYGRRVELGFPLGVHDYPYLYPAVMRSLPKVEDILHYYWQSAVRFG